MQKEKKDKHFIKKPIYEGGPKALKQFISKNLQYPKEALEAKIEGSVSLKYSINNKGKVIKSRIISGLSHGCNEEAERLVHSLKFTVPKNRGVRAIFHKNLTIHFRLPKQKTVELSQPKQPIATPSQNMQIQYVTTTTQSKKEEKKQQDDTDNGYSYTINW